LDMTGRMVASQLDHLVVAGQNDLNLPVATLANGIYLLRVTTPNAQLVHRIVVAH
jgi:hypothetical protein